MKRFVIERNLSGAGRLTGQQLKEAAAKSNEALARFEWQGAMGPILCGG
jgi:hypothetical protein